MTYRYVESSENYEAWQEAKRHLITATDVATLASSSTAGWAQLKARKAGKAGFPSNQYMQWGIERETVIAQIMAEKYPWLAPNTHLVRMDEDPRFGATPDMLGDAGLCQIKTSLWKGEKWSEPPQKYVDQCQWEMYVTGLDENILAVEYYEPTEDGFRVVDPFEPVHELLIERDPDRIVYLIELAEKFLAMGEPSPMDALIADWADAKIAADVAKDRLTEVEEKIRHEIGQQDSFKHVSEIGSVTLTTPKPTERFDSTRFKKENEDTYREYVTTSQGKPRLTVRAA